MVWSGRVVYERNPWKNQGSTPVLDVVRQVFQRIDADAVLRDLEVEVGSRGVAGGAGDAQHVALVYILPHADAAAAEMGVERVGINVASAIEIVDALNRMPYESKTLLIS